MTVIITQAGTDAAGSTITVPLALTGIASSSCTLAGMPLALQWRRGCPGPPSQCSDGRVRATKFARAVCLRYPSVASETLRTRNSYFDSGLMLESDRDTGPLAAAAGLHRRYSGVSLSCRPSNGTPVASGYISGNVVRLRGLPRLRLRRHRRLRAAPPPLRQRRRHLRS